MGWNPDIHMLYGDNREGQEDSTVKVWAKLDKLKLWLSYTTAEYNDNVNHTRTEGGVWGV